MIYVGIVGAVILALAAVAAQTNTETNTETKTEKAENTIEPDVIMPTKVSRPGCEETDSCYVPHIITIKQGEQVTWLNGDVAFHSVTSGLYDSPSDLFDSGHLDPQEKFTVSFDEKGIFNYFCTLHPWMAGQVVVE